MCQYCAAGRLTLSTLRARTCTLVPVQQIARRTIATTTSQAPTIAKPQTMSKSSFLTSVAVIGGVAGAGAAYVTSPSS